jgi:hypothetical protein
MTPKVLMITTGQIYDRPKIAADVVDRRRWRVGAGVDKGGVPWVSGRGRVLFVIP